MPKQVIPDGYYSWIKLRNRCYNPKNQDFQYYGGRGVRVCQRWDSFANFIEDMGPRPSKAHSIDRIDPNGDYEPGNCRWATVAEQNRNKRSVRKFLVDGREVVMKDFAAWLGVDRSTIGKLLRSGVPAEDLIRRYNCPNGGVAE